MCVGFPLYHVGPESGGLHTEIPFHPLSHNFKKVFVSYSVLLPVEQHLVISIAQALSFTEEA